MRVQIRPRGPSSVKLKFMPGLPGPQGIQGIQGSLWYSGNGAPAAGSYRVGDWYLNIANGDVYEKTDESAWTLRDNLTGPQGLQGIQGIQGLKGDQGIQGNQGIQGVQGDKGWSPVLAVVADSTRRVLQVVDWIGGAGTKPATGSYIGATGLVAAIASAVDIRGPAGPPVSADSIDNTLLANMAVNTIKGRVTAGTGDPEDLTAAQARTLLSVPALADFANSLGTNGNQKFPNGLELKWGYNAGGADNFQTFPVAFPTQCVFATAQPTSASLPSTTLLGNSVESLAPTGFTYRLRTALNGGSVGQSAAPFFWFAIGR